MLKCVIFEGSFVVIVMCSGARVNWVGGSVISMGWRYAGFTFSGIGVLLLFFSFIFVVYFFIYFYFFNFHSLSSDVFLNG